MIRIKEKYILNLEDIRKDLSIRGKNGIGFLSSGLIVWAIITVIFTLQIGVYEKSIFMLFATGLMFPLSLGISHIMKADWKIEGNPLAILGMYLNIAQIIYFPILIWAIGKRPEEAVIFFAIITSAHFFPYGWFYHTKSYSIMAPLMALLIMLIGWNIGSDQLWLVPLIMVICLFVLILWIQKDYKNKSR